MQSMKLGELNLRNKHWLYFLAISNSHPVQKHIFLKKLKACIIGGCKIYQHQIW